MPHLVHSLQLLKQEQQTRKMGPGIKLSVGSPDLAAWQVLQDTPEQTAELCRKTQASYGPGSYFSQHAVCPTP